MRKIVSSILWLLPLMINAQFNLSGKIVHKGDDSTLSVNIPVIYGYYAENTVTIPIHRDGSFQAILPVKQQQFVYFQYGHQSRILLAQPRKSLSLVLDSTNGIIQSLKGNAAEENRLLNTINLSKIPFFMTESQDESSYAKLNPADVREKVIKPWYAERDKKIELVKNSRISNELKALIISEINYSSILQLDYYGGGYAKWTRKQRQDYIIDLYKNVSAKPEVFPAGLQYYYFASNYARHLEVKAYTKYEAEGSKKDVTLDYFGISVDSGTRLIKEKGKSYFSWLAVKNNFDKRVAEKYLAQQIILKYRDKDLSQLNFLLEDFEILFPKSVYLVKLKKQSHDLEELLLANANNKEIQVFEGYQQIRSIYEVIGSLKGKVVYLDIWGTWCGPCKSELRYTPELKKQFKGKDIVFLYLDMDEEEKDEQWKKFIKVNELTGLHLRKNRQAMQAIWDELDEKDPSYPSYYIFDKQGKLAVANAKRPSDETELYAQLESILKRD